MRNHLKDETSPYLLQHAENPVNWYPWGEEDKPVFLSIGYSACHWCHVMARESVEGPDTADLLNRWFTSVKVDREERPDLDSVYTFVCQAFTGGGGLARRNFSYAGETALLCRDLLSKTPPGRHGELRGTADADP